MHRSVRGLGLVGLMCAASVMPGKKASPESTDTLKIAECIYRYGTVKHLGFKFRNVRRIVEESFEYTRQHPDKPYRAQDLIAIAWVESNFNPEAVGLAGERGAWQIWDWKKYLRKVHGRNPFDVHTNLMMAVSELDEKFAKYKDTKICIVAYNGLYYDVQGRLKDGYYWNVVQKKHLIRDLSGGVGAEDVVYMGTSGVVAVKN